MLNDLFFDGKDVVRRNVTPRHANQLLDYVDDMIKLFGERDMIQEGEALYLSTEEIYVTRQDFEILRKKLR